LKRRAFARVAVRNHLRRTGHSLEYSPEVHLGLVNGRIRSWIKKAFDSLALARRKVERELDVELHGTDDDRELMARRKGAKRWG
jgi:hypothetical protein